MSGYSPFTPGGSVTLSVTPTAQNVALPVGAGSQLWIANTTAPVWIRVVTTSTALATANTTAAFGMPATTTKIITIDPNSGFISAVCTSGTSQLYVCRGDGQ